MAYHNEATGQALNAKAVLAYRFRWCLASQGLGKAMSHVGTVHDNMCSPMLVKDRGSIQAVLL